MLTDNILEDIFGLEETYNNGNNSNSNNSGARVVHKRRAETALCHAEAERTLRENCVAEEWRVIETAFRNRIQTGIIVNINYKDVDSFLNGIKTTVVNNIQSHCANRWYGIKVQFTLSGKYIHPATEEESIKYFSTSSQLVLRSSDVGKLYTDQCQVILNKVCVCVCVCVYTVVTNL